MKFCVRLYLPKSKFGCHSLIHVISVSSTMISMVLFMFVNRVLLSYENLPYFFLISGTLELFFATYIYKK